ncbi:hypothetical protein [Thiomicrospira sp. ALE5]|uniref:hypothetical protein n=1 Tax=Thiomicrospira sp. ALE5 TaxID=748650 RepID=UPI0008EFB6FA|nr:hypothetical protein [Thiomicrospira sp. ALE5]SFR64046.1 hypothetical protein SAMN03092900_1980 [Thiomicrospira sp. ALE5]
MFFIKTLVWLLLIALWIVAILLDWGPVRDYSIIALESLTGWVEQLSHFGDWLTSQAEQAQQDASQ